MISATSYRRLQKFLPAIILLLSPSHFVHATVEGYQGDILGFYLGALILFCIIIAFIINGIMAFSSIIKNNSNNFFKTQKISIISAILLPAPVICGVGYLLMLYGIVDFSGIISYGFFIYDILLAVVLLGVCVGIHLSITLAYLIRKNTKQSELNWKQFVSVIIGIYLLLLLGLIPFLYS